MSLVLRYLLLFLLPVALGFALDIATAPVRMEISRQSSEFLRDILSNDPKTVRATVESVGESGFSLSARLEWATRAIVVIGFVGVSRLIPQSAPQQRAVNLLTTLCIGFGFAKTLGLFYALGWVELALCLILGLGLAVFALSLAKRLN